MQVNETFQNQYRIARETQIQAKNSKVFDFDETRMFGKFDLFCRRVSKLIDLFTTIQQFSSLACHKQIDGMETMNKKFTQIINHFRRKPYDFLDYTKNQFDRDYLEFNVSIHDLEASLQVFD